MITNILYPLFVEFGKGGVTVFMENGQRKRMPTRKYFNQRGYGYHLSNGGVRLYKLHSARRDILRTGHKH